MNFLKIYLLFEFKIEKCRKMVISVVKVRIENGDYIFKLDNLLKDRGISINKLMKDTNTDFKVIKRIMTGELVRFDIFAVARLCDYLNCKITDIIEYVPSKK